MQLPAESTHPWVTPFRMPCSSPGLALYRRETEAQRQQRACLRSHSKGHERSSSLCSEGWATEGLLPHTRPPPSSYLLVSGCGQMVQPQSDPPVKSQPEGATERSRDTRKAPPPAWPASCLFPGSNWTEGPRESHHLVCPAQPGVLQRGLRAPTSRGLGTVWPDSGRRAETGQRDREGQKQ
jgi:hypothetical protein